MIKIKKTPNNYIKGESYKSKHCFFYRGEEVEELKKQYGRDDIGLKIFHNCNMKTWGDNPAKGHMPKMNTTFLEATIIQNLMWMHGLAPRVYDLIDIQYGQRIVKAQVTDDVGMESTATIEDVKEVFEEIKKLGKKYGFENAKDDYNVNDLINGKFVDFQTLFFTPDRDDLMRRIYIDNAKYGKIYYHDVEKWDLMNSPRDNEKRFFWLGYDKLDFKGKSYADLGCAGGQFCQYALDEGAKTVSGFDHKGKGSPNPIYASKLLANELGFWNIDYVEKDLSIESPEESYDIVSFLSMNFHIGIPEWLPLITNELCIFEDNSKNRDADKTLEKMFRKVEFIANSEDHGNKPIYHCWK